MNKGQIGLTIVLFALVGCSTTPQKEVPLTQSEAKAQETQALAASLAAAKDAETQRLLVFAWALRDKNGNQAPVVVENGNRTIGDAVFNFLDRTTERLFSVAPAYFAYKGQVRASETTKDVAQINRDVSVNQSNNFLALGVAGINGSSAIGTALATRPVPTQPPTTQVTVSGGNVNVGSGSQANNSNNPVTNPNPVVCVVGANPPCTR